MSDSLRQDADTLREADVTRITLAFGPHKGHAGIAGARDDSCLRCNGERALARLVAAAETTPASQVLSAENLTTKDGGSGLIAAAVVDELHALGPCERCGRDPAAGFASINGDWYCHAGASERLTALRARADGFYGLVANDPEAAHTEIVNDVRALLGLVDKLTKERDDTGSVISALEGAKRWAARAAAAEAAADTYREALRIAEQFVALTLGEDEKWREQAHTFLEIARAVLDSDSPQAVAPTNEADPDSRAGLPQ